MGCDMRLSLRPDRLYQQYAEVAAAFLRAHGIRLLRCDLDYTPAAKRTPLPDETVKAWLFDNPHVYYVDLSQKLWDIQQDLLRESQQ